MSTVSVPLPDALLKGIEKLVKNGLIPNKSEGIRQAVKMYLEHQAVNAVLQAQKEPSLQGNLDDLADQIVL